MCERIGVKFRDSFSALYDSKLYYYDNPAIVQVDIGDILIVETMYGPTLCEACDIKKVGRDINLNKVVIFNLTAYLEDKQPTKSTSLVAEPSVANKLSFCTSDEPIW